MALSNETTTELQQRMQSMPASIQNYINSGQLEALAGKISQAYGFDDSQSTLFINELILFLLIYTPTNDLQQSITEHLELSESIAASLANTVLTSLPRELIGEINNLNIEQEKNYSKLEEESTAIKTVLSEPVPAQPEVAPTYAHGYGVNLGDTASDITPLATDDGPTHQTTQEDLFPRPTP